MRIAVLGWSARVTDPAGLPTSGGWMDDGPVLPIEFARMSADRRLVAVIDTAHGAPVTTRWAELAHTELDIAMNAVKDRLGARGPSAGALDRVAGQCISANRAACATVLAWAEKRALDAVIWSDLAGNFKRFSIEAAIVWLARLSPEEAGPAREEIEGSPAAVETPLRRHLRDRGFPPPAAPVKWA